MTLAARLSAWARSPEGLLCLGLWILFGMLINDYDLESFNLQQMGIEAIVERGHLYVDGSPTPQLQPRGDVFLHDGHLYAAKQPGEFFAGALVYAVLHALGLSYVSNFLITSALVTFFTASLATAVTAACVYRLARAWASPAASPLWPWLAALAFGVGSTALPYAGVTHHDTLATSYLTAAFALLWLAELHPLTIALIGLLLGWTITTSMLPAPMVVVTTLGVLARDPRRFPWMALGGAMGIAPLLAYNWLSFGHPLLVPNVAGQFADTFFFFDRTNLARKIAFYASMATLYAPILWCGLIGLACFPAQLRSGQLAVAAMIAAVLVYVCNIQTLGGCQYGPRYLLPAVPFLAIGLVGFSYITRPNPRRTIAVLVIAVAALSAIINSVGALYGAMYCDLRRYGFTHYLTAMRMGIFRAFPLALWLAVPLVFWAIAVIAAVDRRPARAVATEPVDGTTPT